MHGRVVEMQQISKEDIDCDKVFYSRVWWKDVLEFEHPGSWMQSAESCSVVVFDVILQRSEQ